MPEGMTYRASKINIMKLQIFILIMSFSYTATAQTKSGGVFNQPVVPGPAGVYIFIPIQRDSTGAPDKRKTFIISRQINGKGDFKRIATLRFPSSAMELENHLGPSLLNTILQQRKVRSVDNLYHQLSLGRLDTLGFFIKNPEVLIALGLLYLDKSENRDPSTGYKVESEKDGVTHQLYQKYLREIVYTPFPKFKRYQIAASDSAISCIWYAVAGEASLAEVFQLDAKRKSSVRQFIYKARDTLFVSYTGIAKPGMHYMLYAKPTDFAENTGSPSDTVRVIAASMTDALSITNLTISDTSNGMSLMWDPLPEKSWVAGIEISKSHSAMDNYLVVDTLPADATSWMDRNVIGGTVYYYRLAPVLYDLPNKPDAALALINGQKKFVSEKMIAPQGLAAKLDSARNIRLTWKADAVLNLFGYYVLRGTSPHGLEVISSPVADTLFIDPLKNLNPGSTYFYAIAARDMNMRWSDTSELLTVVSPANRMVTAPAGLSARYTEHGVRVIWNDVSLIDENVIGYVLYKRKKGDQYFQPLMQQPWSDHVFIDSLIDDAGVYEYGCAAMDARGNQSMLSSLATADIPGEVNLYPPAGFSLKNSSEGIVISVPTSVNEIKGRVYRVYRRSVDEKDFKNIANIAVDDAVFVDKKVKKQTLYVYTISLAQQGSESGKSIEKAIRFR